MKNQRLIHLLLTAALIIGVVPVASAQVATDWKEIKTPPLNQFDIPQPKRVVLDNGLVIFLQEDRELPLIRGFVTIKGGSQDEAADKVGLASIYGEVWRTGGTESKTGDELDDFLEARAAVVETSADDDSTGITFDCLKGDFDAVLGVVTDLLQKPAFREEKIPLAKNQINTGIARRNDNSAAIAGREAAMLVYGADSPYARIPEYDTVAAVTRDDLVALHKDTLHPNRMIVGVVGDFDARAMEKKLRAAFGKWKKGPALKSSDLPMTPAKAGVYHVQKDDVTQSEIRLVHQGIRRDNPDYFAVQIMNEIFGGSFSARLFSHIRSDQGLAYAVGGGVGASYDHPGMFLIRMGTKSGQTVKAIRALFNEIDLIQKEPIGADELERAKESILNSFIFRVDSKEEVLREKMVLEFYGYPLDFLDRYRKAVETVTLDDVSRVAKKYMHKDQIAVLVVGKKEDFDEDLSSLGPVTVLDITIPEPGASSKEEIAGNAEGRALMMKVVEGLGGKDHVASIKSVRRQGNLTMKTPGGDMALEIDVIEIYPDSVRQAAKTPMGDMVMVATPDTSFMVMGGQARDLPGSQKEDMMKSVRKSPINIALNPDAFVLSAAGTEKIGDVDAAILDVEGDGVRVRYWIDPATGKILQSRETASMMGAPTELTAHYSDHRQVEGMWQPFKVEVEANGETAQVVAMTSIEINPEVDASLMKRPE